MVRKKRKLQVESLETRYLLAVDVDEIEPNDTPVSATSFVESGTLRGSFATQEDVDYFRFNLSQGEAISVDPIYGDTSGGDRQIFVAYDILNEATETIVRSQDVWTSQFVATTAGIYYLRIHADNPYGPLNVDYAVRQTISPFAGLQEQEPNDTASEATAITAPTLISGRLQDTADTDHFSFNANANEVIVVDFAGRSPSPRVDLVSSAGTVLASDSQGLGLAVLVTGDEMLTLRFTQPTSPIDMLDYVANVVVHDDAQMVTERGNGFADASADWTLLPATTRRVGILQDLDDVDVFAVTGRGLETFVFDLQFNSTDYLSLAGRRISLYNEYGQLMAYADGHLFGYGEMPALSTPGRYFLAVQATSQRGLGAYALSGRTASMFSNQRDVPLYFFDFDRQVPQHHGRDFDVAFHNPEAVPFLVGWFEAYFDRFDVDVTTQLPTERMEYISQGIGQFAGSGNAGSGNPGFRSAIGDSITDTTSSYNTDTIMHEIMHASTLNHVRGSLQQIARGSIAKGLFPGTHFGYGGANSLVSGSLVFNPIDQLDWVLQAGSQSRDSDQPEDILNLNSMLAEMEIEFADGPVFHVGAEPHQVASGDFDGDGFTDLATANASRTVSILFGTADGTLTEPFNMDVGPDAAFSNSILVIDVNNDGRSDIVHANNESAGTISVQLGNTDRTFTDAVSFPAGSQPRSMVSADFDKDGNLDVAVANYSSHTVTILAGAGDGSFTIANTLTTAGRRSSEFELVDLNNDDVPDLVVMDQLGGTVTTFLGIDDGTFGTATDHAIGGRPFDAAGVDLNGDSFLDLAVNDNEGRILLFASDGSGGLSHLKTIDSSPATTKIESADINGDGLLDLLIPAEDNLSLDILIHLAGTSFSRPIKYHVGGARESSVLVTDWNADGIADIWLTDRRKDNLRLMMGQDNDDRNDRAVVHGQISTSEDRDTYELTVEAGSTFLFDIDAAEFQYPLDAGLLVVDSAGKLIAFNSNAVDRESGFDSVDPYLVHTFDDAGTYYIHVVPQFNTTGKYRFKVTDGNAVDRDGPRLLRASPEQGEAINQTRQLLFWFNDQLDPASFTDETIRIVGASTGPHAGWAEFDPMFNVLVWRSETLLPVDNYNVILDGITDLHGNALDGESTDVRFPAVSGDGHAGGTLQFGFSISTPDVASANLSSLAVSRGLYNTHLISLRFSEHLDVVSTQQNPPVLTAAGPDELFDTADDWTVAIDVLNNRLYSYATLDGRYFIMTRGFLSPGNYRLAGNLNDEAGLPVQLSEEFVVEPIDLTHGVSVVDMNYQPGSFTSTNQRESIQVRFSSPIDQGTLTPNNFRVWYSEDSRFFETSDVPIHDADGEINWNLHSLTATFQPAEPLQEGFYLVELAGDATGVADRYGNLLDGEFMDSNVNGSTVWSTYANLASGDGRAGGDYRAFFGIGAAQADQAELTVSFSDESISEKDGDTTLIVRRNGSNGDLRVRLLLDDDSEVAIPSEIVIPHGQTSSIPIAVHAIDDRFLDGIQTIAIVATAEGYEPDSGFLQYLGQGRLDIADHESLTLIFDTTAVAEGAAAKVTIMRSNSDIASPLTVRLLNSDPSEIQIPDFATIPSNAASVTIQIAAVEDTLLEGSKTVSITASADGYFSGSDSVDVFDQALDFGDAPFEFPTTFADDGARHFALGPRLGESRDSEHDGQPNIYARGDDDGDDVGVMFGTLRNDHSMAGLNIDLQNADDAIIDAWLDFDQNGAWTSDEQILDDHPVVRGLQTLNFNVPGGLVSGARYARIRLSSYGVDSPTGLAIDGEVEDVELVIVDPSQAPTVDLIAINDGSVSRSQITSLVVTFDIEVDPTDLDTSFTITNVGTMEPVETVLVHSANAGGRTTAILTFSGTSTESRQGIGDLGHSLADGNYRLTIDSQRIQNMLKTQQMAKDYVFGGNTTGETDDDKFFRIFGDTDGDRDVDGQDYGRFGLSFLKSESELGFASDLDSDGDGDVDGLDYGRFGRRFLKRI